MEGIWYNHADPGFWLEENPAHYTTTFDPARETWVGMIQNIHLPGAGSIFFGAGRIVVDSDGNITFWAGPNDFIEGDFDALCSALSGP